MKEVQNIKYQYYSIFIISQVVILAAITTAYIIDTSAGLAMTAFYIAGWYDGLMDTTASQSHYQNSIFKDLNAVIFNGHYSWIWKYKNGDTQREAFKGALLLFTSLTDYWHWAKMLKFTFIGLGVVLAGSQWYWFLLFHYSYFIGKQLTWNLLLPQGTGAKPSTMQLIAKVTLIYTYYPIWSITTKLSNKLLREKHNTSLFENPKR